MNPEHPRRAVTVPLPVPQGQQLQPPAAPPLPPQQRARNALNRFLGFPAKTADGGDAERGQDGMPKDCQRLPSLSAHNASASHKTGLEINSLSINEEGTHALLAGREIFKTVRVDEGSCTEDVNLRTAIRRFDAHVSSGRPPKDAVNIHDVAWGKGPYGNYIAAASTNGPIMIYDLNHPGIEVALLSEHRRQVHRVTFNPHAGQQCLSGSQDGTVRLWDLRDIRRDSGTFHSRFTTTGQNEGVRDVKWSSTDVFGFALCTDGGFVQRWDTRKLKTPLMRIAAHTSPCATIDWHPDGRHLLSASADKTVKVWNLSTEGRRNKAVYEIKTPHPLRNARWRPSCQSSMPTDRGARQCTQIVTSYERDYPVLHVWDFRRPWLPFREIAGYSTAPTDLLWHSQDLLWTVGKEGMFLQHDVKYAPKVLDKRNMQAIAVSPLGEINIATQKRAGRVRPSLDRDDSETFFPHRNAGQSSSEKGAIEQSMSRGSADDSLDETFLSTSFGKRRQHVRQNSNRSVRASSEIPTSTTPDSTRTMTLEDVLNRKQAFKPGQGSARGTLPGSANVSFLTYFAQKYKSRPLAEPLTVESFLKVPELFEVNAMHAQRASMYRMAQSWRIVGRAVMAALQRRANAHRDLRIRGNGAPRSALHESPFARRTRRYLASERRMSSKPNTPLAQPVPNTPQARPVRTLETPQPPNGESSSNVPTPLARPVSDHQSSEAARGHPRISDMMSEEELIPLPPSILSPSSEVSKTDSKERQVSTGDDFTGLSWYDSEQVHQDRKAELGAFRPERQIREPLSLDVPLDGHGVNIRPPNHRHDSEESFGMFPSLSSRDASMPGSSMISMRNLMDTVHEKLSEPLPSPHGSMNMGSSSSSEPTLAPSAMAMSFYSYPSRMRQQSQEAVSSSEDSQSAAASLDNRHFHGEVARDVPARDITKDMHTLAMNNQHSFSSAETVPSPSRNPELVEEPINMPPDMEASGTIVPDFQHSHAFRSRTVSNTLTRPTSIIHATESAPAAMVSSALASKAHADPHKEPFVPADFLASIYNVDTEKGRPFTLISMLKKLLEYHTRDTPDAQALTHFLFLLTPLLPETQSLPQKEIDRTIEVYTTTFEALGYSDAEIYTLLNTSFEHLIKAGLQPLWAENVISTYHETLQQLGLFNNAAYLRRLAYPSHPGVWEQGVKDTQMSFLCGSCKKPVNNPNKMRCENCWVRQDPCPICECVVSPFEDKVYTNKNKRHNRQSSSMIPPGPDNAHEPEVEDVAAQRRVQYSTCLLCNHAAHTACLRQWHSVNTIPTLTPKPSTSSLRPRITPKPSSTSLRPTTAIPRRSTSPTTTNPLPPRPGNPISDGACPTPGCLCACTPGLHRDAHLAKERAAKEARDRERSSRIKDDEWAVSESGAVGALRNSAGSSDGRVMGPFGPVPAAGPGAGGATRKHRSASSQIGGSGKVADAREGKAVSRDGPIGGGWRAGGAAGSSDGLKGYPLQRSGSERAMAGGLRGVGRRGAAAALGGGLDVMTGAEWEEARRSGLVGGQYFPGADI